MQNSAQNLVFCGVSVDHFKLAVTAAVVFLIAMPISSHSAQVEQSNDKVKVRVKYENSPNTPDHLVFGMTLRSMHRRAEADPEIARQIVQARFGIASASDSERILGLILESYENLTSAQKALHNQMLCAPNRSRDKAALYKKMDALDDARADLISQHYLEFLAKLDDREAEMFTNWLDERKLGYGYRAAEHESLFESSGTDVIAHVDRTCERQ